MLVVNHWVYAEAAKQEQTEISFANGLFVYKRTSVQQPNPAGLEAKGGANEGVGQVHKTVLSGHLLQARQTHLQMQIDGILANATVTQEFINDSGDWIDARYQFPLPENAVVESLVVKMGAREIIGEIKSKQVAKKQFMKARREGKRAGLVSQTKPNLFVTELANIEPGQAVSVQIGYQQKVDYVAGQFRLRFPTTYTPRFNYFDAGLRQVHQGIAALPASAAFLPEQFFQSQAMPVQASFSLDVELRAGMAVKEVHSPHYPIWVQEYQQGEYFVSFESPQLGDRDLELTWQAEPNSEPQLIHYREATDGGEYGLLLFMPPNAASEVAENSTPRRLNFVVDTSGSMAGESISQAKAALKNAINALSPSDEFNLVQFNSGAESLWYGSRPATLQNKDTANAYLAALQADGGTNMIDALGLSLSEPAKPGYLNQMVFVTDGAIGYEENMLALLEQELGETRLFTVGIGSAPNSYFMKSAAQVGKGRFTHIGSEQQVESRIAQLAQYLQSPQLLDISVEIGSGVEVFPEVIPDLYQGEPVVLSYFSPVPVSDIQVAATKAGGRWQAAVQLPYWSDHRGIAKYWARQKVDALLAAKRSLAFDDGRRELLDLQALKLALKHQIVSPFTSLVAIDHTPVVERLGLAITKAESLSHSMHMPQTATAASLSFVLASIVASLGLLLHFCGSWLFSKPVSKEV